MTVPINPETPALLGSLIGWLFHPFVVVHLCTFLIVKYLKETLAQALPLRVYNSAVAMCNRVCGTNIKKAHKVNRFWRHALGALVAMLVAFGMSYYFWPVAWTVNGYTGWQVHFINAILNPLVYFGFTRFAKASGIVWLQSLADWFGAKEVVCKLPEEEKK